MAAGAQPRIAQKRRRGRAPASAHHGAKKASAAINHQRRGWRRRASRWRQAQPLRQLAHLRA